jgi:DNA-binding transcriptional MocR family regulator
MARQWIAGRTAAEIAASLEAGVRSGRVGPGDLLPTVRGLSDTLRVSPATVAAAYRLLRARGLATGQGRRGTRVAAASAPAAVQAPELPPGTIDLATGNPDPSLLPPLEPALHALDLAPRVYGMAPCHRALLGFAGSEFETDGIPSRAITVVSGALDAIERILREHLQPGDRVAVEDPCFPGITDLVTASGLTLVPFAVDDEGPRPDALDHALGQHCRALIVTPRAQNPTGAAIDAARARDLHRVLSGFPETVLIENDYAGPIAGAPLATLCGPDRPRWAAVRSTAKFLGPDLRVAVLAGDELTVARVQGRQALGMRWVSHILQQLTLALWSDPSSGRRLARAADIYAQRRAALVAALAARGIQAHGRSGLNVWVPVREEARVVSALAERGWAVAPGERFRIRTGPAIRVTISTLAPPDAERLAADLAAVLRPGAVGFA